MLDRRREALRNPANWFILAGLGALGASVWLPFQTAERTARVESRAGQITSLLLEATQPFDGRWDAAAAEITLARFHRLARRDGVLVGDLEVVDEPAKDVLLTLRNKHYAFQIAVSPPDVKSIASPGTQPALEVEAWPLAAVGPGHSVFFHPENAPRAYTRNLGKGYAGFGEHRPPAGSAHRGSATVELAGSYRSLDGERWILF